MQRFITPCIISLHCRPSLCIKSVICSSVHTLHILMTNSVINACTCKSLRPVIDSRTLEPTLLKPLLWQQKVAVRLPRHTWRVTLRVGTKKLLQNNEVTEYRRTKLIFVNPSQLPKRHLEYVWKSNRNGRDCVRPLYSCALLHVWGCQIQISDGNLPWAENSRHDASILHSTLPMENLRCLKFLFAWNKSIHNPFYFSNIAYF